MSVRAIVIEELIRVAQEQEKLLITGLEDNVALLDSGLDSLCFAAVVARLKDIFGVDPFSTSEEVKLPVTIGDFIALYERTVSEPPAGATTPDARETPPS